MAFNRAGWTNLSSSANLGARLLQDGSYSGGPAPHSYIHAVDTVATIEAADYFNEVAAELSVYDRIHAVGSDGIIDLRVTAVTFNPTNVTTTTTLGLGDVNGPAASTDNAVTRFDGITGKVIQNSGVILSDADALTGITSITIDNININGNSIISTDVNGDINLTPNGTGDVVIIGVTIDDVSAISGVTEFDCDNLNLDGNTLSSTDTNGDINLSPNGSGTVVINTDLDIDNININGNTISSTDTNGNINLTPNGSGDVVIIGVTIDDVNAISGLTEFDCDNININGNTIISTDTDGNISLTPNGTGLNVLANCQVTNVTASRAVVTDVSSNLNESVTTATELSYVNGVTSAIQTQINALIAATYQITVTQAGHGLTAGKVVYYDAGTPGYLVADTSAVQASNDVVGIIVLVAGNDITIQFGGHVTVGLAGLTAGVPQYVDPDNPGDLEETKTLVVGEVVKLVMVATSATSAMWVNQLGVAN